MFLRGDFFLFAHKVGQYSIKLIFHLTYIIITFIINFRGFFKIMLLSGSLSALNLSLEASYFFGYQLLSCFLGLQIILSLIQMLFILLILFLIHLDWWILTGGNKFLHNHILIIFEVLIMIVLIYILILKIKRVLKKILISVKFFLLLLKLLLVWLVCLELVVVFMS